MDLENKIIIEGYKEITPEEFYDLKQGEGLRLFDYYQDCKQIFYKKNEINWSCWKSFGRWS